MNHFSRLAFITMTVFLLFIIGCGGGTGDTQPTADAGDNQYNITPGGIVTLDGSDSDDPKGKTLSYSWEQVGGYPVTITNTTIMLPTFTMPQIGYLRFKLTVSNGKESSRADYVMISTLQQPIPANQAPTAHAGPDQEWVSDNATLDGTGSTDPEADPLTCQWFLISGSSVTLDNAYSTTPTFDTGNNGLWTFGLIVYDNYRGSETDEVIISTGTLPGGYQISGTVQDIGNEAYLDGITCTIKELSTDAVVASRDTNSSGTFECKVFDLGTYRVFFSGTGYIDHFAGRLTVGASGVSGLEVGLVPILTNETVTFIDEVLRTNNNGLCKWSTAPVFWLYNVPSENVAEITTEIQTVASEFSVGFVSANTTVYTTTDPLNDIPGYDAGTGVAPGVIIIEWGLIGTTFGTTTSGFEITAGIIKIKSDTMSKVRKSALIKVMTYAGESYLHATDSLLTKVTMANSLGDIDKIIGRMVYHTTLGRPMGNQPDDDNPSDHDITP